VEDDLVISGAGSGCNTDDEDECTPLYESGSGNYIQYLWHDYNYTLNARLNPIWHLLALLGAQHIFHITRIRVKDQPNRYSSS